MAKEILEVIDVAIDDDDEISVLYATPPSLKKGTNKTDAISVEDYKCTRKPKRIIDLSQNSSFFDDELEFLHSFPKTRVYKGESSNSKPVRNRIPLNSSCEICADEKPRSAMFRILGCNHYYCCECMSKYVASKLQENISQITCPDPKCNGYLEPYHCHSILPKQVFDRWGDALCEAVILASEKFYCPFKDCSALLIDDRSGGGNDDNNNNNNQIIVQSECPDCNRLFCVQCKVPWHTGIKCEEFQKLKKDERSNEDIMLMKLAKSKKWQRCLKCGYFVEKSEGCLFMKCRCGYCFCYNCGAPLKDHYCPKCKR
ncbi:hypothetical protein ACJIZ3_018880 [Penstemon smallii]|uniref:RBR-type E3 ubiquitin transferase n=1 Tax=Penstemon smallii TaxID=265156 RepID=A0ABD3T066_9LAMI